MARPRPTCSSGQPKARVPVRRPRTPRDSAWAADVARDGGPSAAVHGALWNVGDPLAERCEDGDGVLVKSLVEHGLGQRAVEWTGVAVGRYPVGTGQRPMSPSAA